MNRLMLALRKALSSGNHPAIVGLVDGLLYFVLSYATIVGSSAVWNHAHPNNTTTPDYGWLAFNLGHTAVLTGAIAFLCTLRVHDHIVDRSTVRTILCTIVAVAFMTGVACALTEVFTDTNIITLDVVQYTGMIGLVFAPFGYRLFGFVKNPNAISMTIPLPEDGQPALGVSDDGNMLGVWTPSDNSTKK